MPDSTEEEARRCPTCQDPGKLINKRRATSPDASPGTQLILMECHNDRCKDFVPPEIVGGSTLIPGERGRWFYQVNADGTVPPKGSSSTGPKAFDSPSVHSVLAQRARDNLRYLAAKDERHGDAYEIGKDLGYQ